MSMKTELYAIAEFNLKSIAMRWSSSAVVAISIACVVGVFVSLLAVGAGLKEMSTATGQPDRAIILSKGAHSELRSSLHTSDVDRIGDENGIMRGANGAPLISADYVLDVDFEKHDGSLGQLLLRGVSAKRFIVSPEIKLVEGRLFRSGLREIIVGRAILARFPELFVGGNVRLRASDWKIVGVFEAEHSLMENSILADADTVASEFRRDALQSVTAKLTSAAAFDTFKAHFESDPDLSLYIERETDYLENAGRPLRRIIDFVATFIATTMAAAAVCSVLTAMYSNMESRGREVAVLRAVGFTNRAVVVAFLMEALCLGMLGGLFGILLAYLAFDGSLVSLANVNFAVHVSWSAALKGLGCALLMGAIGGVIPSLTRFRRPIALSLK